MALKNRFFFAYQIERANPGAGDDAIQHKGGYLKDAAIAGGSYPNPANRITSMTRALSKAHSWLQQFQGDGLDCHVKVFRQAFGSDAEDAVANLPAGYRASTQVALVDGTEPKARRDLNKSNRSADSGLADGDFDETDGQPENGGT